ncbi:glycosyltransferase family 2 protein [Erysipelotrichaceae bacterium HCN-30851]
MPEISIVIPVYFNELNLIDLYKDLYEKVLINVPSYEIVFIDDGSKDRSYEILKELKEKDRNIKVYKLSRNFGSHAAILAGLSKSTGKCAMVKAADLQEPSEMILDMYEKWKKGNNVVLAVRKDRNESRVQKWFSNTYYKLMKKTALPNMPEGGFDCFLVDRKVIDVLEKMDEKNTSLMMQVLWCGFKTEIVEYVRLKREKGKSKWTFSKKIKLVIDSLLSFSYLPIRMISLFGIVFSFGSLIFLIYLILAKLLGYIDVSGWTTLMVVLLFTNGMIMTMLGVIGEYLWRTFDASRKRPVYIIEEYDQEI